MIDPTVALRRCTEYNPCEVLTSIEWLYREAGGPDPRGKKILVKPNILSDDDPRRAVTTHPVVVEAVIRYLKSRGAEVLVGDSPTFDTKSFTGNRSGIRQVTESCGAQWVRFNDAGVTKKVGNTTVKVSSVYDEVDYVINLPKFKNHELMYFTGAIKNIFGLVPGFAKVFQHTRFPDRKKLAEFFVDLEETLRPAFHIMDGIVAMEGPGPGNGIPRKVNVLLASQNPLALDITASRIAGYDPTIIPTNRIALERGKLLAGIDDIIYKGEDPQSFVVKDFRRITTAGEAGIITRYLKKKIPVLRRFDRRPVFDPSLCIACMKCVDICPVNALSADKEQKNRILINDPVCIRCFCCHEVCRDNAIRIERNLFY